MHIGDTPEESSDFMWNGYIKGPAHQGFSLTQEELLKRYKKGRKRLSEANLEARSTSDTFFHPDEVELVTQQFTYGFQDMIVTNVKYGESLVWHYGDASKHPLIIEARERANFTVNQDNLPITNLDNNNLPQAIGHPLGTQINNEVITHNGQAIYHVSVDGNNVFQFELNGLPLHSYSNNWTIDNSYVRPDGRLGMVLRPTPILHAVGLQENNIG